MIVNRQENGWEIIFQRAHGLLAAKIALELQEELWPTKDYWLELLLAIAEHDDGQKYWGQNEHLTPSGDPRDFGAEKPNLHQGEKVVENSIHKSSFIALMTSLHAYHLRKKFASSDPDFKKFIQEQLQFQQTLLQVLNIEKEKAEEMYRFLRWCDELSLILCKKQVNSEKEIKTIGELPKGLEREISIIKNGAYAIHPWCFKRPEVTFSVESYLVPEKTYKTDRELAAEISSDHRRVREFILRS